MSLSPGTRLGPYAVTAKIGEGGMGEVLSRNSGIRLAVLLAAAGLVALALLTRTAYAQATFEYAAVPDALVIQLSQDVGILDADPTPLLRVYGDGLARIHFPVYMRRAGDYTLQLDQRELQDLLALFVQGGLIDFSPEATQAQMRGVRRPVGPRPPPDSRVSSPYEPIRRPRRLRSG